MEKLYYFCPQCDEHEVLKDTNNRCPKCGGKCLAVVASPEAIITDEDLASLADQVVDPTPEASLHSNEVFAHRFARFMEMGFGPAESSLLANTREDTHRIRRMLREGCGVDVAVAILL